MNAVEFTDIVIQSEQTELQAVAKPVAARHSAPRRLCDARVAYALLAVIALLCAWLAFAINNSLDQINAQLEGAPTAVAYPPTK